ncbi:MAG: hypothetical protein ABFD79_13330 [Phycisphaerales bacterium]
MKTMRMLLMMAVFVLVISYCPKSIMGADPGSDDATCAISVTVSTIIEWDGGHDDPAKEPMPNIVLANITEQASAPEGTSTLTLFTNCTVDIGADDSEVTKAAQLTHQRGGGAQEDFLITEYQIADNGDSTTTTGASDTAIDNSDADIWTTYDLFLDIPLRITHVNTDGAVDITLSVRATNTTDNVEDSGLYQATQTLTAAWVEDN